MLPIQKAECRTGADLQATELWISSYNADWHTPCQFHHPIVVQAGTAWMSVAPVLNSAASHHHHRNLHLVEFTEIRYFMGLCKRTMKIKCFGTYSCKCCSTHFFFFFFKRGHNSIFFFFWYAVTQSQTSYWAVLWLENIHILGDSTQSLTVM